MSVLHMEEWSVGTRLSMAAIGAVALVPAGALIDNALQDAQQGQQHSSYTYQEVDAQYSRQACEDAVKIESQPDCTNILAGGSARPVRLRQLTIHARNPGLESQAANEGIAGGGTGVAGLALIYGAMKAGKSRRRSLVISRR